MSHWKYFGRHDSQNNDIKDNGSFTLAKVGVITPSTVTATCDSHYLPWWHDINRNYPICVGSPKVAKESTVVTVACCYSWHYHRSYRANFRQWKHGLTLNKMRHSVLVC